ncbi:hypothetical protein [Mucilaginibacter sp. NFX135]|uniref:hypothetical protein n=1 Tax=Mucilaginibacter sp. NFX135 TaxID=3402687 RepID=UPI003AFB4DD4
MELTKRYKPFCCLLLCVFSFQLTQAQTFAEWFSQKKTQLKYLRQQIAALSQYGNYVKQGYRIAQGGWGDIGNWVKSEFDLHSAYYCSLRTVNPVIKNDPKADGIVTCVQLIPQQFDHLDGLAALDGDTRGYVGSVKTAVLAETDKDLAELQMVMSDGKAQLTDDARIRRLDAIDERVRDKLTFSRSFCSAVRMLIVQRNNSLNDMNTLKGIYGLN